MLCNSKHAYLQWEKVMESARERGKERENRVNKRISSKAIIFNSEMRPYVDLSVVFLYIYRVCVCVLVGAGAYKNMQLFSQCSNACVEWLYVFIHASYRLHMMHTKPQLHK